jgi:hypothetical protein
MVNKGVGGRGRGAGKRQFYLPAWFSRAIVRKRIADKRIDFVEGCTLLLRRLQGKTNELRVRKIWAAERVLGGRGWRHIPGVRHTRDEAHITQPLQVREASIQGVNIWTRRGAVCEDCRGRGCRFGLVRGPLCLGWCEVGNRIGGESSISLFTAVHRNGRDFTHARKLSFGVTNLPPRRPHLKMTGEAPTPSSLLSHNELLSGCFMEHSNRILPHKVPCEYT